MDTLFNFIVDNTPTIRTIGFVIFIAVFIWRFYVGREPKAPRDESFYRKQIQKEPKSAITHFELAEFLSNDPKGQAEAEAEFRRAIELDGTNSAYYEALAKVVGGDPQRKNEAEILLKKAIEISPEQSLYYFFLGQFLAQDPQRARETEAAYRKAIELNRQDAIYWLYLANFLVLDPNRRADAEVAYQQAIQSDPRNANIMSDYAEVNDYWGETTRATEYYKKAIELNGTVPGPYRRLVTMLRQDRQDAEALPLAERWVSLKTDDHESRIALASIYRKLGRIQDAAPLVEQLRKIMVSQQPYNLACLESVAGNADAAFEYLVKAAADGQVDRAWAMQDPDLEWIRADPRFADLLK